MHLHDSLTDVLRCVPVKHTVHRVDSGGSVKMIMKMIVKMMNSIRQSSSQDIHIDSDRYTMANLSYL